MDAIIHNNEMPESLRKWLQLKEKETGIPRSVLATAMLLDYFKKAMPSKARKESAK